MNTICLDRCSIDLSKPDYNGSQDPASQQIDTTKVPLPQTKTPDELLYLSDKEAACIESCTRLYLRSTHRMVDHFKRKLCFDNDD